MTAAIQKYRLGMLAVVLVMTLTLLTPSFMISPGYTYAAGEVVVQYRTGDLNSADNQLKPHFNIKNNSTTSISLQQLKLRYYFTSDGTPPQQFNCDWAQIGCSNVSGAILKLESPVQGADHVLEITFDANAGQLAAGAQTGDIQIRIHKTDWSNYNELDDYSYVANQTSYASNDKVTLYQNGELIYGIAAGDTVNPNPTPQIPSVPSSVSAVAGNAQVLLNWTAVTGADSYSVKRALTSSGPYTSIASSVLSTSYVDTSVSNGTTYYYVVSAVNTIGESANSIEVSAMPSASTSLSINGDTTIAALCPNYKQLYLDRTFLDYLPSDGSGGHGGHTGSMWMSDVDKAAMYGVNVTAIQEKIGNGTLTLAELGTQALPNVQKLEALHFPRNGICQLLPRLALLSDDTDAPTYHKNADNPWSEVSQTVEASNQPATFIQELWPTDARTYQPAEKAERDRIHDQPIHENNAGWTFTGSVGAEILYDKNNPVLNAVKNKVHPVTGEPLGGNSFTSNAPMSASAKMHVENEGFWYQVLEFKNTSEVPYFLDGAVIWWVGPSGLAYDLRNGHYNNSQRPGPGYGHPQRDIIEVVYDEEKLLSVYVIRLAFHDEPYNMRTSYPNQYWSLEVGTPAYVNGTARFTTSEQRQQMVDLMVNTLHVELETNLDRNIDLLNALKLRNRVSN